MQVQKRRIVVISVWMAVLVAGFLLPHSLLAQSAGNSGQIVGQVVDPSLAAVPGAEVAARNTNTNFVRTTFSDTEGRFAIPLLPLGPYEIITKAAGFEPVTQEALVTPGGTVTTTFTLAVGVNREAIEVSAAAGVLPSDITVAASRSVLTDLQLRHLPTNGGRVQNIIWDMPTGQIEPE